MVVVQPSSLAYRWVPSGSAAVGNRRTRADRTVGIDELLHLV